MLARLETPHYAQYSQINVTVFFQLGKETKSYNKKKLQNQKLTARKDMKNKL